MAPKIPDPKDRSVNKSTVTMDNSKAVKVFNQEHGESRIRCTQVVQSYIEKKALELGWNSIKFTSRHVVFQAEVELKAKTTIAMNNSNVVQFPKEQKTG